MFNRRKLISAALFALLALGGSAVATAQGFPNRVVTIVVPFPAGGITDAIARQIAQQMQTGLGKPVIVENRPGGGGQIAAAAVKRAEADGHTIFIGATEMFAINPTLYRSFAYDPLKDFKPVTGLAASPLVLVVPQNSTATTPQELIALSKGQPNGLSYASQGIGSIGHMLGSLFQEKTGAKLTHVPYRGSAPALQEMMAGQVDMMFDPVITTAPLIKGGKLKAIAIAAARRSPALPDVRTLSEAGIPGMDAGVWFGMVVKAGTPDEIVARLNEEVVKALKSPEVAKRLTDQGMDALPMTPQQFGAFLESETKRWIPLVKASGATVD